MAAASLRFALMRLKSSNDLLNEAHEQAYNDPAFVRELIADAQRELVEIYYELVKTKPEEGLDYPPPNVKRKRR